MNESRLEGSPREAALKQGARRSVHAPLGGDRPVVVKRWHASGPARLLDRWRAGREHALARRLAERGLPVPRPIELRRSGGRCELVSERIEGAVPLARVLAGASWPVRLERSMGRLGEELARLHAAGLEHGDLHAGNVLLDPRGDAWLVDLSRARLHRAVGSAAARAARVRDLVQLAVETREVLPESARARFLVAWANRAAELGLDPPGLKPLAAEVERAARLRRRANVVRHLGRWTRASGVADAFELPAPPEAAGADAAGADASRAEPVRGVVRAGLDAARALSIASAADDARPRALDADAPFPACVVVRRGGVLGPRDAWLVAARLEAHHLPAPRPWCLVLAPEPLALFGLPRAGAGCGRADGASSPRRARELGTLSGALADRGIALSGDATDDVLVAPDGALLLGLGRRVVDAPPAGDGPAGPFAAAWSALDADGRAAWTAAWIAARRGGGDERRRLAAEHGRG